MILPLESVVLQVAAYIAAIGVIVGALGLSWRLWVKPAFKKELDEILANTQELKTNGGSSVADHVKEARDMARAALKLCLSIDDRLERQEKLISDLSRSYENLDAGSVDPSGTERWRQDVRRRTQSDMADHRVSP